MVVLLSMQCLLSLRLLRALHKVTKRHSSLGFVMRHDHGFDATSRNVVVVTLNLRSAVFLTTLGVGLICTEVGIGYDFNTTLDLMSSSHRTAR